MEREREGGGVERERKLERLTDDRERDRWTDRERDGERETGIEKRERVCERYDFIEIHLLTHTHTHTHTRIHERIPSCTENYRSFLQKTICL